MSIESAVHCPDCGCNIVMRDYVVIAWSHYDSRPICAKCQREIGVDARGFKLKERKNA